MGLAATVGLVVAIAVVHAQQENGVPQQGGADSPERQAIQNTPVSAFEQINVPAACAANPLTLLPGVRTPAGTIAQEFTPLFESQATVFELTFSTEIVTRANGTVNLDYSIDGRAPVPIGPEFFAHDSPFFVTRTAQAFTMPPFFEPIPPGQHSFQPVLTAFGEPATAFFRCFSISAFSAG
jgi:hypothetical protein